MIRGSRRLTGGEGVSKVVELEPPICEFCGGYIVDEDHICPACDDGRCCYS